MAEVELNLKLVVVVETSLPPDDLRAQIDSFFENAKSRVRFLTKNQPVTILRWHYHTSAGPVDETEG